jgi:hypothetical protein
MAFTRELARAGNQTIRQALQDGGVLRQFSTDESEDRWVIYTGVTADSVPVAVVNADRLIRIMANVVPGITVVTGEAMVTKREVQDDPTASVDRRALKLADRAAKAAQAAQAAQAALEMYEESLLEP